MKAGRLFLFALAGWTIASHTLAQVTPPDVREVQVAFSPRGDALDLVLSELRNARQTVDVAMFYLAHENLIDALCFLSSRQNIRVRLIADIAMGEPAQRPLLEKLARYGVEVYLVQLPNTGKMHLKCLVVDERLVVTGTANWTQQAFEGNFEDTVLIHSDELARRYRQQFESLIERAEPLRESSENPTRPPRMDYPRPSLDPRRTPPDRVDAPRPNIFRAVRKMDTHFMPCPEAIATLQEQLRAASNRVDLALFLINEPALAQTLADIAKAGRCRVRLLADHRMLDPGNLKVLQQLAEAGAEVRTFGTDRENLHLKTAVIDDRYVWTGSANWTQSAMELNVEDMLCFDCPDMARDYRSYLDAIARIATPFVPASLQRPEVEDRATYDAASGYLVGLPPTGPRTNWNDLATYVDFPAFEVEADLRYVPDEQYFPLLMDLIRSARQSILIDLYLLPPPPASGDAALQAKAVRALEEAVARGVYVRLLLYLPPSPQDRLYRSHSDWAERLRSKGVDVRLSLPWLQLHEKFVVVDLCKILIGSHNWSEGALSGERVNESSALLVLPRQDIRWAEYVFSRPVLSDMRSREAWEREAALIRQVSSSRGSDRDALIQTLEEDAP